MNVSWTFHERSTKLHECSKITVINFRSSIIIKVKRSFSSSSKETTCIKITYLEESSIKEKQIKCFIIGFCLLPKHSGVGFSAWPRYYYNNETNKFTDFSYKG